MKRLAVGWILGAIFGAGVMFVFQASTCQNPIDSIISVAWGDGQYGDAFYGAEVYLEDVGAMHVVKARVHIGRGNGYFHDIGEIGRTDTAAEAVANFGNIEWADDGLTIGSGDSAFYLPRDVIENHR